MIDLQRWYLERGHEAKLARVGALIAKANDLIDFFHEKNMPVVHPGQFHKTDGSTWNQSMRKHWTGHPLEGTVTEGTWEAQIHPDVHRCGEDVVLTKTRGSAFIRTELEEVLGERDVSTVVLAGYSTDRCVGLTAIDAWERDFRVMLAGEAILGTTVAGGDLMLDYLRGGFGIEPFSNAGIKEDATRQMECWQNGRLCNRYRQMG